MTVITIKDKEMERDFKEALKEKNIKAYIFYLIISQTGFRAGDILPLRVRDVRDNTRIKTTLGIRQKKTNTYREVPMPTELRKELNKYIRDKKDREPLFPATSRARRKKGLVYMDYSAIYKILREVGEEVGLYGVGTHTGRKTYGYRIFKVNRSLGDAQLMLEQKDIEHTRRYVGADEDYKQEMTRKAFG